MSWFRSRLLWRVYAGYVVIIALTTSIVGILIIRQVSETSTQDIHHSLAVRSDLLAEIARQGLLQTDPALQHQVYRSPPNRRCPPRRAPPVGGAAIYLML